MENIARQRPTDVKRVVLYGPESTGKTTLAQQLSDHFGVPWVPEFAREYLQAKWDLHRGVCEPHDLIPIAIGQMDLENKAVEQAEEQGRPFIVCDTDLLVTLVYSQVYYDGWADARLVKAVRVQKYDLYFLTGIDVPWKADDLRDRPHDRERIYEAFKAGLVARGYEYVALNGNPPTRLEAASVAIEGLL